MKLAGLYDFKRNPIGATGELVFTLLMAFACLFPSRAVAAWHALAWWGVNLLGQLFH